MRFDSVVVVTGCSVNVIDAHFGFRKAFSASPILISAGSPMMSAGRPASGLWRHRKKRPGCRRIFDLDKRSSMFGLFERFGNDDRHRLAVPMDFVVLHDG